MSQESFESITNESKEAILLESLKKFGATFEKDMIWFKGAYIIQFPFKNSITTIRIVFAESSGADLVITNMTTLPEEKKGQGFGSKAIQQLLLWAKENNLINIRAVQIEKHNESFWEKNGFVKDTELNQSNDFIYQA